MLYNFITMHGANTENPQT